MLNVHIVIFQFQHIQLLKPFNITTHSIFKIFRFFISYYTEKLIQLIPIIYYYL